MDIESSKVEQKIEGSGSSIWSVGISQDAVAWGTRSRNTHDSFSWSIKQSINLNDLSISFDTDGFRSISTINGDYSLSHSKGGMYRKKDAILNVKKGNTYRAKITNDAKNGISHISYGWYKDYIVSGGRNGSLNIYTKDGIHVSSLVGHIGDVLSLAVYGDRLVSGSRDQTIKVWDLSKLRQTQSLKPSLTLFISNDDNYVAYTQDGFFDSSKKGTKYVGYHINQGESKSSKYLSVDKFYNSFYRPDLVAQSLEGKDISYVSKSINIDALLGSGLPPVVAIKTQETQSESRDLNLNLEVCSSEGGYDNLTLYLNSMVVDVMGRDRALKLKKASKSKGSCFNFDKLISLQDGKNVISFKATNRVGNIESNMDTISVSYKGVSKAKPNLYILAIGIDKYRDGDLWLNYSTSDAKIFSKTILDISSSLYENSYKYTLNDAEATRENILKTFEEIGAKNTRDDVFILYMAGHGVTDAQSGEYYYLPVDFRYETQDSVAKQGMGQNDFKKALSNIKAMKSLTVLDTCNSGSFAEAMASRGLLQKTAINKLTRATGRATMVASSKDQVALEGYKGHGVFTYTIVEGLKGKAYGNDSEVTIKEIAGYTEDVVPERTYEKWGYEQVPQSYISGNDFPIGVKK